jgi:hypothetical protein
MYLFVRNITPRRTSAVWSADGLYLASAVTGLVELPTRIVAGYIVTGFGAVDGIAAPSSIR